MDKSLCHYWKCDLEKKGLLLSPTHVFQTCRYGGEYIQNLKEPSKRCPLKLEHLLNDQKEMGA